MVICYKCPFCEERFKYWGLNGKEMDWGLNYHIYMTHESQITEMTKGVNWKGDKL